MKTRREFVMGGALAAGALVAGRSHAQRNKGMGGLAEAFAALEKRSGARLGVGVLDAGTGQFVGHRVDERFAMCSTCKVLLVAAVLNKVDAGQEQSVRAVAVPAKPLMGHSPLTEPHAGATMTVAELCHASIVVSDNTATNLLLGTIGGPEGYTRSARSIGDTVTRLDRTEGTLNTAIPGDPRDTTSPRAAAEDLQKVLLGNVLSAGSRALLLQWMEENQYGMERLRKDLPAGWRAADKTGSNGETTGNDIGIYFPPNRKPVIVTAYVTECQGTDEKRGAILAEVGLLVRVAMQA